MQGTYPYCRTKEAIKRLQDDDVVQRLSTEMYYKIEHGVLKISHNTFQWEVCPHTVGTFPPYEEWRSLTNLHYYSDLKKDESVKVKYLTPQEEVVSETHHLADKTKKRWFLEELWS